jgi:hypothetical protein
MAIIKISELPSLTEIEDGTIIPVVATGHSRKITVGVLKEFVLAGQLPVNDVIVVADTFVLATQGKLYVLTATDNTTSIALPVSPEVGNRITIANFTGRSDVLVIRSGSKIMGLAEDFIIDKISTTVAFCYINTGDGWIIL